MPILLVLWLLQGGAAPPESESAWACTAETLAKGTTCTFEGDTKTVGDRRQQADQNRQATRRLAASLCAQSATTAGSFSPDRQLARLCEKNVFDASVTCVEDLDGPLIDASGRFASNARDCYQLIAAVLQKTQLMAATASSCCRCLAKGQCGVTGERCYRDLAAGAFSARAQSCMKQACGGECPGLTASGDEEEQQSEEPPEPPRLTAPKTKAVRL
jgi:hypothetical protein